MDWTSWQENWASVGQNLTSGCKEKWLIYGSAQFRKVYTNDFLLTARATISLSSKSRNWNQEVEKLKKQLGKNPAKVGVFVTWLGISSNNHRTPHSIDEVPPLCPLIPALGGDVGLHRASAQKNEGCLDYYARLLISLTRATSFSFF